VRNLRHADVRVGEQGLGSLDIIIGEFRRMASRAAKATGGGEARLGALPDQTALEFRQRAKHEVIASVVSRTSPIGGIKTTYVLVFR
jgi:hypothetical protein